MQAMRVVTIIVAAMVALLGMCPANAQMASAPAADGYRVVSVGDGASSVASSVTFGRPRDRLVKQNGNVVLALLLVDSTSRWGERYIRVTMEFDCKDIMSITHSYRFFNAFDSPIPVDDFLGRAPSVPEWSVVTPGTVGGAMWRFACEEAVGSHASSIERRAGDRGVGSTVSSAIAFADAHVFEPGTAETRERCEDFAFKELINSSSSGGVWGRMAACTILPPKKS